MKRSLSDTDVSSESSHDESDFSNEEDFPEVLQDLSNRIPRQKALDFLHTLASSKGILYWNSHGEMLYHQRRIPVTNIAELVEYAMLPYSLDVKPPRGLNTFVKGLGEIGINKQLIRNKRLLADLVARDPDSEEESTDSESDESSESDNTESDGQDQESDGKLESHEQSSETEAESEECHVCRDFKPFYSIAVVQCPKCLWREGYYMRDNQMAKCDICCHLFPVDGHTMKSKFVRCQDCDAVHQVSLKSKKLKLMEDNDSNNYDEAED